MGFDDRAADPQQKGSSHLFSVHPFFEVLDLAREQHRPHLGQRGGEEHLLQFSGKELPHPLGKLQHHIAGKAVGYRHIAAPQGEFPGLHITHIV